MLIGWPGARDRRQRRSRRCIARAPTTAFVLKTRGEESLIIRLVDSLGR